MARISDDIAEAKETFCESKRAADGMASTGMLIVEKLVSQGTIAEANSIRERINRNRAIVNEFRDIYKEVLSFTDTWHPGQGSQIDGAELYRAPSQSGSHRSNRSNTSSSRRDEQILIQGDLAQIAANQKALQEADEIELQKLALTHKVERLRLQAEMDGKKAKLQIIREEPEESQTAQSMEFGPEITQSNVQISIAPAFTDILIQRTTHIPWLQLLQLPQRHPGREYVPISAVYRETPFLPSGQLPHAPPLQYIVRAPVVTQTWSHTAIHQTL